MEAPVQQIILEQYKTYNRSKEAYIDRHFTTNRFYTSICLFLLLMAMIGHVLIPKFEIMVGICVLGMFTSSLWWLNVDSYNTLIKIKYARILEVLEQSLPKQPFREEFSELSSSKVDKKAFVFPDVQKIFASVIFIFFAVICAKAVLDLVRALTTRNI